MGSVISSFAERLRGDDEDLEAWVQFTVLGAGLALTSRLFCCRPDEAGGFGVLGSVRGVNSYDPASLICYSSFHRVKGGQRALACKGGNFPLLRLWKKTGGLLRSGGLDRPLCPERERERESGWALSSARGS